MIEYLREHSQPLDPVPTGVTPVLRKLEGIRAVVFDIYGTLFVSAAGDISLVQENASDVAMELALEAAGAGAIPGASKRYRELIAERQARSGKKYPEVEIREVWRELMGDASDEVERAAVVYECNANPVWPMPGCAAVLESIRSRGLALGIVSNAQFYTRLLFPAFLGGELEGLGFDPELMVFSYEEREGKPSRALYRKLAAGLAKRGISAGEALYAGNDLKKDIWPAGREGFKTALFAGDRRSLRRHEGDPEVAGVVPDLVVTEWGQLLECVEMSPPK